MARFGYNTLRYHHHENRLIKNDPNDSTIIDPEKMDQFDYLFAALKKRGIYFTTDVYVSRDVRAQHDRVARAALRLARDVHRQRVGGLRSIQRDFRQ